MAKRTAINITKTETVQEFLKRGGKINKILPHEHVNKEITVRTSNNIVPSSLAKSSSSLNISLSKEDFLDAISKIDKLSDDEKERLLDRAESMSELAYQSPDLEDAAMKYGEKTERKKKYKELDHKEVDKLSGNLPDYQWLIDELMSSKK